MRIQRQLMRLFFATGIVGVRANNNIDSDGLKYTCAHQEMLHDTRQHTAAFAKSYAPTITVPADVDGIDAIIVPTLAIPITPGRFVRDSSGFVMPEEDTSRQRYLLPHIDQLRAIAPGVISTTTGGQLHIGAITPYPLLAPHQSTVPQSTPAPAAALPTPAAPSQVSQRAPVRVNQYAISTRQPTHAPRAATPQRSNASATQPLDAGVTRTQLMSHVPQMPYVSSVPLPTIIPSYAPIMRTQAPHMSITQAPIMRTQMAPTEQPASSLMTLAAFASRDDV